MGGGGQLDIRPPNLIITGDVPPHPPRIDAPDTSSLERLNEGPD